MALTTAQQTEMDKLKADIEKMRVVCLETSPSLQSMYGSFFFEEFQKINNGVKSVEES